MALFGSKKFSLFLSHKAKDAATALEIKQKLTEWFSLEDNCIFVSADANSLRGGDEWRTTIDSALKTASWLVLLFTDPRQNWDWCIYEVGYFVGNHADSVDHKVTVLHPEGIQPPAPLERWQRVKTSAQHIIGWLQDMFRDNPKAKAFSKSDWQKMAGLLAPLIQRSGSRFFKPNMLMTVTVPPPDKAACVDEAKTLDVALAETTYEFTEGAAAILARVPKAQLTFGNLEEDFHKCYFDLYGLSCVVAAVHQQRSIPSSLGLFKGADGVGYRPIVAEVQSLNDGRIAIQLMFVPIPSNFNRERSAAFEVTYHVFVLAAHFRWQVVEPHAMELKKGDLTQKQKTTLLKNILHAIDGIYADAHARGMGDQQRVNDAFPRVAKRLLSLRTRWSTAYEELKRSVREDDGSRVEELLTIMRSVNFEYMRLSVSRLKSLVDEFNPPETHSIRPELQYLTSGPSLDRIKSGVKRKIKSKVIRPSNRGSGNGRHRKPSNAR